MDPECAGTLANYNNIMRAINYHQDQIPILQNDVVNMLSEVNRCNKQLSCRAVGGARHKRSTKRVKSNYRTRNKSRRNHIRRKQRR